MRDPHVEALYYEVSSGEGISYSDPKPISFSNPLGTFDLSDGELRIVPFEHFANEDDARSAVEPFLKSWEIEADLTSNIGMIRFGFDRAKVIDRDPPPPGSPQTIHLKAASMSFVVTGNDVQLHLTCRNYPQPPKNFDATYEVQVAYRRWLRYISGEQSLQNMAYFVLTSLERTAGTRKHAARKYKIEKRVLDEIGELSSTKGDESTARKFSGGGNFQELSSSETKWLEEAIRRVIHRLGEYASGAPLALITITMNDLPKL